MQRHLPALAVLLTLGACATPRAEAPQIASAPADAPTAAEAHYVRQVQEEATAQLAAEPADALPQDLSVTVTNVELSDGKLAFEAELRAPRQGARRDRRYAIFGRCDAADLAACGRQVVIGAKLLKQQETAAP